MYLVIVKYTHDFDTKYQIIITQTEDSKEIEKELRKLFKHPNRVKDVEILGIKEVSCIPLDSKFISVIFKEIDSKLLFDEEIKVPYLDDLE